MADSQPDEGTQRGRLNLYEAADKYTRAQTEWNEAYLYYKMGTPPKGQQVVTDTQAKVQADLEIPLLRARLDWEIAKARFEFACRKLDVELELPDDAA